MALFFYWEDLDEINGDIPDDYYFPYFADIAVRARKILDGKTSEQISECAKFIDFIVEMKFESLDSGCESQKQLMDDKGISYAQNSKTISAVRALKMDFEERYPNVDFTCTKLLLPDFLIACRDVQWQKAEFFAVLTLIKLLEAVSCFSMSNKSVLAELPMQSRFKMKMRWKKKAKSEVQVEMLNIIMRTAAMFSMEAMQSINDAEELKRQFDNETERRDRRSVIAEELNVVRHRGTYEAKEKVLLDWEGRVTEFGSAPKAGNYYATWLENKGLKTHEPNTIAEWIRGHARKKNIKLR